MTTRVCIGAALVVLFVTTVSAQGPAKGDPSLRRICFAGNKLADLKTEAKKAKLKNKSLKALGDSELTVVAVLMDIARNEDNKIIGILISIVRDDAVLGNPYVTVKPGDDDFDAVVNGLAQFGIR
jgi:hypothetical protein